MSDELRQTLINELATDVARAIEAMTSEQPELKITGESPAPGDNSTWRQKFSAANGAAWLAAATQTWISLGTRTLRAAGIDDTDDATSKSTFAEILGQAFSMLARSLSGRTQVEWACIDGGETSDQPESAVWSCIHLTFPDGTTEKLFAAFDNTLLGGDASTSAPSHAADAPPPPPPQQQQKHSLHPSVEHSKTLELLLDVELPVSVSFGRAQLPLKDVIKLTTGSIVELNRTITEPVEVIVNNCVIARGEVVVIEGNFGVRIQQVISREERLRTLY